MWRGHGGKVICLTTGGLMDMWKQSMKHGRNKVYHEKSAEAVVPGNLNLTLVGDYKKGRAEP